MYNKELETIPGAKATHDGNQAKTAQERLKKNAEWRKKHNPKAKTKE